jgi:hypothetical protein
VKLTLYLPQTADNRQQTTDRSGLWTLESGIWSAEASVSEWIWSRPPLLVTRLIETWRPEPRRRSRRQSREVEALLELDPLGEFPARTENVSHSGLLLLLRGCPGVAEGDTGRLTLHSLSPDFVCGPLPCRVARVLHWLRPSGRSVEVGVHLLPVSEPERHDWQQCLARLGVGTDEVTR